MCECLVWLDAVLLSIETLTLSRWDSSFVKARSRARSLCCLMGDNVEPHREFIEKRALEVHNLSPKRWFVVGRRIAVN